MQTKDYVYPDQELYNYVINEMHKRNINSRTIGEIAYQLQHQYLPNLTVDDFGSQLKEVLKKREVLNILALGFQLDNLADRGQLDEPLQSIIENDAGVFGLDESNALSLAQMFGSISVSNFGFADKQKMGIAKELDLNEYYVNTFADDLVSALVSAVVGRCGHGAKLNLFDLEEGTDEESSDEGTTSESTSEQKQIVYNDMFNLMNDNASEISKYLISLYNDEIGVTLKIREDELLFTLLSDEQRTYHILYKDLCDRIDDPSITTIKKAIYDCLVEGNMYTPTDQIERSDEDVDEDILENEFKISYQDFVDIMTFDPERVLQQIRDVIPDDYKVVSVYSDTEQALKLEFTDENSGYGFEITVPLIKLYEYAKQRVNLFRKYDVDVPVFLKGELIYNYLTTNHLYQSIPEMLSEAKKDVITSNTDTEEADQSDIAQNLIDRIILGDDERSMAVLTNLIDAINIINNQDRKDND